MAGNGMGNLLTFPTCLDPVIQCWKKLPIDSKYFRMYYLGSLKMDMEFLQMFLLGSIYWEESEADQHVSSIIMSKLAPQVNQLVEEMLGPGAIREWGQWESVLKEIIRECQTSARESCLLTLCGRGTLKCNSFQHNHKMFLDIADYILEILRPLVRSSTIDLIPSVKSQITFIQRKLKEFTSDYVNYSKTSVKKLRESIFETQTWFCYISRLVCLYWIDGMNQSLAPAMEILFSSVMYKIMPYTPGIITSHVEATMIPQLFASYFDFLLQDFAISNKGEVDVLHQGLIFLVSFVMDPPEEDSEDKEEILAQINAIINALPSLIALIRDNYEIKGGVYKPIFSSFLRKIDGVEAQVRELYVNLTLADSSQLNSPTTHPIGFLDLLVRTIQTMLEANVNIVPSTKHHVKSIQIQLELLKPFLLRHVSLQTGHAEFKHLWTRTIDVLYHASYVTKFCLAKSCPFWYGIVSLPNVIENIKLIKTEFEKVEGSVLYKNKIICVDRIDSRIAPPPESTTKVKEVFIGFKKDVESLVEYLIGGQNDLTIISISGMPGQGKTTLARKIHHDARIRHRFYKIVWCYVSKECNDRDLLIRIGSELLGPHVNSLETADIANSIRRSLLKQRYLIVMDDVWDVDLWNQVQISFPDDCNGSRILFTSRNHDLASQTRMISISYPLRLFSDEESWELMQKKLFSSSSGGSVAPEFLEISEQIVKNCQGLPLAVALIASLLKRNEGKLDLWNEVAKNLKSHLKDEGCMNVIELSYKYLPEYLKPCFLYFGLFPRGERVFAGELKRLWMSEGFIKDDGDEMQYSNEGLAKEYLDYLVAQNLVIVVKRGSLGQIQICNVHDLLYDLCLVKAKEENFFDWTSRDSQKYYHHRLCIGPSDPFIIQKPNTRMRLSSRVHSLLWPKWYASEGMFESSFENFKSLKVLTVLNLEKVTIYDDGKILKVLMSLIHLRYLALSFSFIDGIPTSITDLWNLETLVIHGQIIDPLPVSMWNMRRLRYVDVSIVQLHLEDASVVEEINNSSLTRLGSVCLVDDWKTEELLSKLTRLRKLKCKSLKIQKKKKKEHCSKWTSSMFGSLTQLESLCLEDLEMPFSCKRSQLVIMFPGNLKKLSLSNLRLPWSALSAIGKQLPNLLTLKLSWDAFEGSKWSLEDGDFPKLRYLELNLVGIHEIDASACEDNPFPCLEQLVVEYCEMLKEIPSIFGEIATLNSIRIKGSSTSENLKESVRQILEDQRELGNKDLQLYVEDNPAQSEEGDDDDDEEEDKADDVYVDDEEDEADDDDEEDEADDDVYVDDDDDDDDDDEEDDDVYVDDDEEDEADDVVYVDDDDDEEMKQMMYMSMMIMMKQNPNWVKSMKLKMIEEEVD